MANLHQFPFRNEPSKNATTAEKEEEKMGNNNIKNINEFQGIDEINWNGLVFIVNFISLCCARFNVRWVFSGPQKDEQRIW